MKKLAKKVFFGLSAFVGLLILISVLAVAKDVIADVSAEVLHSGYKDITPDDFLAGAILVDIRDSLRNDFNADAISLVGQYEYLGFFTSETNTYITFSNLPVKQRIINENCSHGLELSICAIVGYSIKPPIQTLVFEKNRKTDQLTLAVHNGSQAIELNPYQYTAMYKTGSSFLVEVFSK